MTGEVVMSLTVLLATSRHSIPALVCMAGALSSVDPPWRHSCMALRSSSRVAVRGGALEDRALPCVGFRAAVLPHRLSYACSKT
jgi:hypothetical protein